MLKNKFQKLRHVPVIFAGKCFTERVQLFIGNFLNVNLDPVDHDRVTVDILDVVAR